MFDTGNALMATKECRPDPEMMLQRARNRKERIDAALTGLVGLRGIYVNGQRDDSGLALVGSLYMEQKQLEEEIASILKEIDQG